MNVVVNFIHTRLLGLLKTPHNSGWEYAKKLKFGMEIASHNRS